MGHLSDVAGKDDEVYLRAYGQPGFGDPLKASSTHDFSWCIDSWVMTMGEGDEAFGIMSCNLLITRGR